MNVTFEDFLALLPIVQGQGWHEAEGVIRNKRGECPACALATAVGLNLKRYSIMPNQAWGQGRDLYDAICAVVDAADRPNNENRGALKLALGMRS